MSVNRPASSSSVFHDRRGFDTSLKALLVLMPFSLLVLILYSWKLGLSGLIIFALLFLHLESISAPPANSPRIFLRFTRLTAHRIRRPILVCLGDSLTHGTMGASYTPEIPRLLAEKLGMDPPDFSRDTFADPLWVVNCGQNGLMTETIRSEPKRLKVPLRCMPDYIFLWIGTNDILAMYQPSIYGRLMKAIHNTSQLPTLETLESNLRSIIESIQQESMRTQIGVGTLPPLGENLKSPANELIRKANAIIERTVNSFNEKCTIVPIYQRFETVLEKKHNKKGQASINVVASMIASFVITAWYYLLQGILSWNAFSQLFGNVLFTDGIHLNDNGKDLVLQAVVEWLININVAKAIAVKSM